MVLSNKWPKRDLYREMLINDWVKAVEHAEMFRSRADWVRCNRKVEQAKGFAELIARFDAWKPKPKEKRGE